jgi:hypothetical protein
MWLDIFSVITVAIVAFVVIAYAYRWWRISHRNEPSEAGGSMGDQMIGPRDDSASKPL